MCPTCQVAFVTEAGDGSYDRCPKCRGIWIAESGLREYVRRCAAMQEFDLGLVSFQESPAKALVLSCPSCREPTLRGVKLRAVLVGKCSDCEQILLKTGAAELIAERVMVAAKEWTEGRKLTGNFKLDEILRNPTSLGSGG